MDPRIILGVPGPWETHRDIVISIAKDSGGYLFAGCVLMNTATKEAYSLEVVEHDPRLQEAFRIASGGRIPGEELAAIARHRHVAYCSSESASVEIAQRVLEVGVALLNAGGLAVKVESSGTAHSATRWQAFAKSSSIFDLYTAFVTLVGGKTLYYSCGMHNFGFAEAAVSRDLDAAAAARLLNTFNHYVLSENPTLTEGNTFSVDAESPRHKLRKTAYSHYGPEHPFHNPFGTWELDRVT